MTMSGINRWKLAKASATSDGSGQIRIRGEGDDPPIKKDEPVYPPPKGAGTATLALSPLIRPAAEGAGPPIMKKLRVRGSQKLQAVRPDASPGDEVTEESPVSPVSPVSPPRRRRKRRPTRAMP